mgnify:CR=1 FL=1
MHFSGTYENDAMQQLATDHLEKLPKLYAHYFEQHADKPTLKLTALMLGTIIITAVATIVSEALAACFGMLGAGVIMFYGTGLFTISHYRRGQFVPNNPILLRIMANPVFRFFESAVDTLAKAGFLIFFYFMVIFNIALIVVPFIVVPIMSLMPDK